jgi:hypothetical protein
LDVSVSVKDWILQGLYSHSTLVQYSTKERGKCHSILDAKPFGNFSFFVDTIFSELVANTLQLVGARVGAVWAQKE